MPRVARLGPGEGPAADPRRLPEVFREKVCVCVPFVLDNDLLKPGSYQRQTSQRASPFPSPPFVCQEAIGVEYDPRGTPSPRGPTRALLGLPLPIPGDTRFSVPASYPRPCHEFVSGMPLGKFRSEGPRDRGPEITPPRSRLQTMQIPA